MGLSDMIDRINMTCMTCSCASKDFSICSDLRYIFEIANTYRPGTFFFYHYLMSYIHFFRNHRTVFSSIPSEKFLRVSVDPHGQKSL